MISTVSGNNSAALLSLSGRPRRADDGASAAQVTPAQRPPEPPAPPPGTASGATAQSLVEALLGAEVPGASGDAATGTTLSDLLAGLDTGGGAAGPKDFRSAFTAQSDTTTAGAGPMQEVLSAVLARLDRDGDGKLSLTELQAAFDTLTGSADPAAANTATGSGTPKSLYQSLFEVLASADDSTKGAGLKDGGADKFLSALTP